MQKYFEQSRKQFYENEIRKMAPQLATILDTGSYSVELQKSRSGIKILKVLRVHEVVKKGEVN